MQDTVLHPSAVTRLLQLLQAALPFLTPGWKRLADLCIRFLYLSDFLSNPGRTDISRLLYDIRGCTLSDDMNALICAIRPFCLENELQMLQMYEQFMQMQSAMEMWKMFSDLMPESGTVQTAPDGECDTAGNPLLSFLSPEQLELYHEILSDSPTA